MSVFKGQRGHLFRRYQKEGTLSRNEPGSHASTVFSREVDIGELESAALGQSYVAAAPALFVIAADIEHTRGRYTDRAERYVYMEAGHAARNPLLEATALGLGAVPVGAFDDAVVARVLGLPQGLSPLYLLPVGHK